MRTILIIASALVAGFLGGLLSRYLAPTPAFAQATAPTEIRAQKFVLVDKDGVARGVFGVEANGSPTIEITNDKGHVFTPRWYGVGTIDFHSPPDLPRKMTLLP